MAELPEEPEAPREPEVTAYEMLTQTERLTVADLVAAGTYTSAEEAAQSIWKALDPAEQDNRKGLHASQLTRPPNPLHA